MSKSAKVMITAEELRKVLHYDPETGMWTWLVCLTNSVAVGSRAGTARPDGRRQIRVHSQTYLSSRLAWLYMIGVWPSHEVDHKNRDSTDDRWCNLRAATSAQNKTNSSRSKGPRGVCFHKGSRKFCAQIRIAGKQVHLGLFNTSEEAHRAYLVAADIHHGEFAYHNGE